MAWKRFLAWAGVLSTLAFGGTAVLAEETPQAPAPEGQPAEPAKAEESSKPGFWGDRFALYIAVAGGGAWSERTIDSSITTSGNSVSKSDLDLQDVLHGRFTVGWQLPANRGHLLLSVNGFREDSYVFSAYGLSSWAVESIAEDGSLTASAYDELLRWWRVRATDGRLKSTYTVPLLVNGSILYDVEDPQTYAQREGATAVDLQNEMQTWDAFYQREFGGRRWSARWSAGGRYFLYEGTVPAAAWLNDGDKFGYGYTDGVGLRLLPLKQKSSGMGPTASLEAQFHLFRDHVVLYGQGRIALIYESLEVDSGPFFTLVDPQDGVVLAEARVLEDRVKTAWHVTAEVGARIRILQGVTAEIGYGQSSFQDSVLVPTEFFIPQVATDVEGGTSILYNTRDLLFGVVHAGLSFQF